MVIDVVEESFVRNWSDCISDDNYSVIIQVGNSIDYGGNDETFNNFLNRYGLNAGQNHYIGVWQGATCLASSNEEEELEVQIGVDGERGMDTCSVSIGQEAYLKIKDVDYYILDAMIQIIVYDNNYREVMDNVAIGWKSEGKIYFQR